MKRKQNKRSMINKRWIFLSICFFGIGIFIFSDLGLIKLYSLQKKHNKIKNEIDVLIQKESMLIDEINKIKENDKYLEKIAREKFQMVKPGEKIFRVVDSHNVK